MEVHLDKLFRRGSECTRRNNMEVQIWLSKQILQTLVVSEDLATITEKVMSPCFECMDYGCKL